MSGDNHGYAGAQHAAPLHKISSPLPEMFSMYALNAGTV